MLMPRFSEQDNHNDTSFGGKHGHAPHNTTVAAHTKMRLLSKVEQNMRQNQQNSTANSNSSSIPNPNPNQNQSIKKLINTAASGNRLVGDVDELLVPMRIKSDASDRDYIPGQKDGSSRPERNLWSRAEMLEMLQIMQQMNALDQLSDRNVKSEHVFRQIEEMMRSKGYVKKSSIQIWTKWKFLKSTYNTTTRHGNGIIPKVVPEEVYRVLSRMLSEHGGGNGSSSGNNIGSECGNSMDSSNAELHKAIAEGDDVRDELGVEHPIFGFRLGLVKSEPLDAGYETPLNATNSSEQEIEAVDFVQNSNSDSLPDQTIEPTRFTMSVKHEPEIDLDLGMDGTNTPPPTAPTSPSPPPARPGSVEQRDTADRTPLSTSLPPLRVAAFASDSRRGLMSSTPTHGVLQIERPGSLASKAGALANPLKSGNRTMPLQSTSSINFVHPTSKLMLPRKQLPMRIPREISLQPASVRPLKAVPMRETGYSLRPDRMIPDLEQSISPPQSPSPPMHSPAVGKFNVPYASTSRQAQQLNEQLHPMRKRRLNYPSDASPVPVKLQRSSAPFESKRTLETTPVEEHQQQQRSKLLAEETTQRRRQQQQQHEEIFKKEMAELASAMHVAQKEMLEDFFQRQKVFARKEHEFQLRQDNLVMSALRKQTDALLRTAQQLIKSEEQQSLQSKEPQHRPQREVQPTELLDDEDAEEQEPEHEQEHEEMCEEEDDLGEEYDDDYSDDDNRSESALVISSHAHSEDASSNSGIPNDRQLSA